MVFWWGFGSGGYNDYYYDYYYEKPDSSGGESGDSDYDEKMDYIPYWSQYLSEVQRFEFSMYRLGAYFSLVYVSVSLICAFSQYLHS